MRPEAARVRPFFIRRTLSENGRTRTSKVDIDREKQ